MKNRIVFRKKDYESFLLFWKKLEQKIESLKNVVIENTDESIIISFVISSPTQSLTLKIIKLILADSLVQFYKEKYFKSSLVLPSSLNSYPPLLIKALSVFDKASDIEYVVKRIKDLKNFNTHSFYVFRLGELRAHWQEISNLLIKTYPEIFETEVFLELLKGLLISAETLTEEVNLKIVNNELYILDKKNNSLTEPIKLSNKNGCINVAMELIELMPASIRLYFSEKNNPKLVGFLNNLFASKVVYCT